MSASLRGAKRFDAIFGTFYGLLGVTGFAFGRMAAPTVPGMTEMGADRYLLQLIPGALELGTADHILHIILGAVFIAGALMTKLVRTKDEITTSTGTTPPRARAA